MMKETLLSNLNAAINRYLRLDPESHARLAKLQGQAITIEFLPFHFSFQCFFSQTGIQVQSDNTLVTETTIRGTPLQMLGVMVTKENRHRFFADDLVIEGDAELGQQVVQLFDELQIDWEEQCARVIGDVPAHQLGRFTRRLGGWLREAGQSFSLNISEYAHEEAAWFPTREALQDFFSDIDNTRMDVDRAEARVQALQQQLTSGEAAS